MTERLQGENKEYLKKNRWSKDFSIEWRNSLRSTFDWISSFTFIHHRNDITYVREAHFMKVVRGEFFKLVMSMRYILYNIIGPSLCTQTELQEKGCFEIIEWLFISLSLHWWWFARTESRMERNEKKQSWIEQWLHSNREEDLLAFVSILSYFRWMQSKTWFLPK